MQAIIRNVQYHPHQDTVAVLVENRLSSFYVNLKQTDLSPDGGNWGDDEVLAATQEKLNTDPQWADLGFVAEYPPLPPVAQPPEVVEMNNELEAIRLRQEEAMRVLDEARAQEAALRSRLTPPPAGDGEPEPLP